MSEREGGEWMIYICILLIITGIAMLVNGIRKAVKSKFNDLDAIIWCWAAELPIITGSLLARFI